MKVGIAVIATERNNFSWSFIKCLIDLRMHLGTKGFLIHVQFGGINQARDLAMKIAKQNNCDYLCFIDSDMTFPHDAIDKIINTMTFFGSQIGAGLYFTGSKPYHPVAYDYLDEYKPILTWSKSRSIDACGMGFTVISKEAFDLSFDWGTVNGKDVGEDVAFCDRARKAGYTIVLDPDVKCGHLRTLEINEELICALQNKGGVV